MSALLALGESLLPFFLDFLCQATVLMLVVFAVSQVMGKARAQARYWLWVYCLVGVLLLPVVSFVFRGHRVALLPARESQAATDVALKLTDYSRLGATLLTAKETPMSSEVVDEGHHRPEEKATTGEHVHPEATVVTEAATSPSGGAETRDATFIAAAPKRKAPPSGGAHAVSSSPWAGAIVLAWLTGCGMVLLRLLLAAISVARVCGSSSAISDSSLSGLFERAKKASGAQTGARLRVSERIASPVSVGIFRPTVFLPQALIRDLPSEQLYPILLHELAHIRSMDDAVNMLERIVRSLLFFHPLAWLLSRDLHSLREEVCDDRVLDHYPDGVLYARVLTDLAGRNVRPRSGLLASLCFFNHRALIERRVERILARGKDHSRRFRLATAISLLSICFVVTAVLSLVSFSARGGEETADSPGARLEDNAAPPGGLSGELPEGIVFEGHYEHRSRGRGYGTSELRIKRDRDGAITAIAELRGTTYVASSDKEHRLTEYKLSSAEREGFEWVLTFEEGKVISTRKSRGKDDEVKEIPVVGAELFDPNSRPDPYCVANILLRRFDLSEGESQVVTAYDWDNSGEGMATYRFSIENKGREKVTVPAGTFEASHIVLTQLTTGNTWYKKRAGHVTEFWVLDDDTIVRILRHREPYELLLAEYKSASPLPGRKEQAMPPVATKGQAPPPPPSASLLKQGKVFIDLDPYVTTPLKGWHGNPGNNLALEQGIHRIGDSEFRIGRGAIEIGGQFTLMMRPREVEGINVGARFQKLEILHATCWGAGEAPYAVPDGTHIGSYVIRYEDGATETIAIKYGVHVRDWWAREGDPSEVSEGKVAWTGENEYAWEHSRCKTRLYSMAWENPHPDKAVRAIDFSSTGTVCGPFLVAMTAEGAQPAPPAPSVEPTPAVAAEGKQLAFIDLEPYFNAGMKAFDDKPGNDLTIAPGEHHLAGIDFRVGERIIWIGGSREENKDMPLRVEGIKIGLKFNKLHFLHSTCWTASEGEQIGNYLVHYEDGSTTEIPLVYGANIRNWWIHGEPRGDISDGSIAWRGMNPYAWSLTGLRVQLYSAAWENPHRDKVVDAMDFVSLNTECAPYLVALTAETGAAPEAGPERKPVEVAIEKPIGAPSEVVIKATEDGTLIVGNTEQSIQGLQDLLQQRAREYPGVRAIVRCHPETPHQTIVGILEACEKAGVSDVSFSVIQQRERGNPVQTPPDSEEQGKTEPATAPTAASPEALYVEGSRLRSQGRTEEALKAWRTLIEKFPESNRAGCAAVYMGQLQLSTKDYKGAEESFKLAAEKLGHHRYGNGVEVGGYGYFYLTHVYCETEQYKKAAEALKALIEKYPYSTGHRMGDALTSFRAKRWFYDKLKAEKINLKFLEDLIAEQKDPKNFDRMNSRQLYLVAHTLMREDKDNPTAIKAFLKGVEKFPEESFTPYGAVFALELQIAEKDHEGAKEMARVIPGDFADAEVGEGTPLAAIAYFGLGAAHLEAGEYKEAAEMFQKVAQDFPTVRELPTVRGVEGELLKSRIAERFLKALKEKGIEVKGFND